MQPQMLAYDVSRDDGMNVGRNNGDGTVPPGGSITYRWYAGDLARDPATDKLIATPVEFGISNLLAADTIEQGLKGLGAVLVIEPPGATWTTDAKTRTAATVTSPSGTFREFVVVTQGSVNLRDRNGKPICPIAGAGAEAGVTGHLPRCDDAEDSGNMGGQLPERADVVPPRLRSGCAVGADPQRRYDQRGVEHPGRRRSRHARLHGESGDAGAVPHRRVQPVTRATARSICTGTSGSRSPISLAAWRRSPSATTRSRNIAACRRVWEQGTTSTSFCRTVPAVPSRSRATTSSAIKRRSSWMPDAGACSASSRSIGLP